MREISKFIIGEKYVYPGYIVDHDPKVKSAEIIDLIYQVEGINREEKPPTGFFAKFKRKEKVQLDSQLEAIRQLGSSASQEALEFLNWLWTPRLETTSVVTSQLRNLGDTASGDYYREVYYPNARESLREELHLKVYYGNFDMLDKYTHSESETEKKLIHQKAILPAHMIINSAIERLRTDLQLITQPTTPS